ncbi:alpha/beta fold hydrolase [Streptomyces sp. NPDC050528]|uniref:alpha/beta fold hydrolase n=1 Tax=Streptomyces sp. NPDC050528 TaxID=3365623 RepID=UPI00378FA52F
MLRLSRLRRPRAIAAAVALTASLALVGTGHAGLPTAAHAQDPGPLHCTTPGHQPITVVLVHGAWADSSSWNGEIDELQRAGCAVRAADNPVENLTTDSEKVAAFVRAIPGPVLLVGHSYGGAVISNAAAEADNVVGLVYVDAAAPAVGEPLSALDGSTSVIATKPASELFEQVPGTPDGNTNLLLTENAFVNYFGDDLPKAQARQLWAAQTMTATPAIDTPSRYAAWKTLPSWYFISTGDKIITPESELAMARRAHSHVTVFHGGSHLTLISHPDAVTAVIAKALADTTR